MAAPKSSTLNDELRRYEIAPKLRALRLRKKLRLVELASHTGLSPALLSKLERGKMFPTLATLLRIAMVFSVDLDYFFADHRKKRPLALVRRADRLRFPESAERRDPSYHFENLNFPIPEPRCQAYIANFHQVPEAKARPHQHAGIEMIYVLTGELTLTIEEAGHTLAEGDAIYFDASAPHSYRRQSRGACTALIFTTP